MLYVVTTDPDGNTPLTPTLHHDRQVAVYGYTTRVAPITNRIARKEDRPWPAT